MERRVAVGAWKRQGASDGSGTLYRKPRTSNAQPGHHIGHRIYPYLLRDLTIDRPDQGWMCLGHHRERTIVVPDCDSVRCHAHLMKRYALAMGVPEEKPALVPDGLGPIFSDGYDDPVIR